MLIAPFDLIAGSPDVLTRRLIAVQVENKSKAVVNEQYVCTTYVLQKRQTFNTNHHKKIFAFFGRGFSPNVFDIWHLMGDREKEE